MHGSVIPPVDLDALSLLQLAIHVRNAFKLSRHGLTANLAVTVLGWATTVLTANLSHG
jgi:hypothetical protein